jgi:hypothetical protein
MNRRFDAEQPYHKEAIKLAKIHSARETKGNKDMRNLRTSEAIHYRSLDLLIVSFPDHPPTPRLRRNHLIG